MGAYGVLSIRGQCGRKHARYNKDLKKSLNLADHQFSDYDQNRLLLFYPDQEDDDLPVSKQADNSSKSALTICRARKFR